MKLYKVNLNGYSDYSTAYAIADTTEESYLLVKKFLDKEGLCFSHERQLKSVELLADEKHYGEIETMLFVKKVKE